MRARAAAPKSTRGEKHAGMFVRWLSLSTALTLCGVAAAQTPGADVIRGEDVPETLRGLAGDDVISGHAGHDEIYGGSGDDIIRAGRGRDAVSGGEGADTIFGDEGNDTLNGGDGNDLIDGGPGGDLIHGDAGDDHIYGGDGDDYLYGDAGADWLHGGPGADRFIFAHEDSVVGAPDIIADFNRAEGDRIDLSRINDAAAFTIVPAFTQAPMQLVITPGRQTVLRFDVDGDGVADGEIQVTNAVTAADIEP